MTMILTEGFDLYNALALGGWGGPGAVNFVAGRIAGQALSVANAGVSFILNQNLPTAVIGFAWQVASLTTARVIGLVDGATEQMSVRMDVSGHLQVTRNGTVLATESTINTIVSTYYYLEFKVVFGSGTSGSYALRRNGAAVPGIPDVAATNTIATANSFFNTIALTGVGSPLGETYDDMYLFTANGLGLHDFVGDVRVASILPSAPGFNTNFSKVGASATNWQSVNESPPNGDTTYVQSFTIGQVETYTYADLPGSTSSVLAVYARPDVRKDDAGTRTLTTHVRSNGTEADVPGSLAPATTYALMGQVMETNPVSGAAWTVGDANSAEFGFKILT